MRSLTSNICRICGNDTENRILHAREMMFGLRDKFDYFQCNTCGCVQITDIPADLGRYYPTDYYAYGIPNNTVAPHVPALRQRRNRAFLGQPVAFGRLLTAISRRPGYFNWFTGLNLDLNSAILDVGCGAGSLLLRMRRAGFSNLTGADPFIAADINYSGNLMIHKADINNVPGSYDLVMLNHSFEHMPDPLDALHAIRRLLRPNGTALIRIPVAGGYVWRKYGIDAYTLDPPRHLHLHTTRSMSILATNAGFHIDRIFYDANASIIIGSELYSRDIPEQNSGGVVARLFPPKHRQALEHFASRLNRLFDGDCAGFILRQDVNE
jgi:SAM-dependent methyltransferase